MEIRVYASKKSYEKDGKTIQFYVYTTRLHNKEKDDDEFFTVKFKDEAGSPPGVSCPMNIIVEKKDCNIVEKERHYNDRETGEQKSITDRTLWVNAWSPGSPYVDHSTDNYFD